MPQCVQLRNSPRRPEPVCSLITVAAQRSAVPSSIVEASSRIASPGYLRSSVATGSGIVDPVMSRTGLDVYEGLQASKARLVSRSGNRSSLSFPGRRRVDAPARKVRADAGVGPYGIPRHIYGLFLDAGRPCS
jgi:hypothetical protein